MIVVEATPDLVPALLERMGPERVEALEQRAGRSARGAIVANIARSPVTWAAKDDDGVFAMGGVLPHGPGGYVWQFVVTEGVRANPRGYLAMARTKMSEALRHFSSLTTVIEADYKAALRHWVRNGGTIGEPRVISGVLAHVCERVR